MLEWKDSLSTGIEVIDGQHKELFQHSNNLITAIGSGKVKENITELFLFLENYIRIHFAQEEKYMKLHHYPAMQTHLNQHHGYIQAFGTLKNEYLTHGPSLNLGIKFRSLLVYWWINHITKVDKALGEYLKGKQI